MNQDILDRGLEDILLAERRLRGIAECQNKELREALIELAYRVAGEALEETRRKDPGATERWGASDWKAFFSANLDGHEGWMRSDVLMQRLTVLEGERDRALNEVDELRMKLTEMENQRLQANEDDKQLAPNIESGESSIVKALMENEYPEFPRRPPIRFASRLSTGERWRREALTLYLMANQGLSVRLEILEIVGKSANVGPRSGSLKRMVSNGLIPSGLATGEVLTMYLSQPSKLAVIRLTEDGKDLCRTLGWEPVESEWEQLIRLHDGEKQGEHTAAVLTFAYHSRKRDWQVELLPPVEGTRAQPDALVRKNGDKVYVEVELGEDKANKWRNMAELQGFVAICTATESKRGRLVSECKLDRLKGMATDIETLIQESGGIKGRLWLEQW